MSRIEYLHQPDQVEIRIKPFDGGRFKVWFLKFWIVGWLFGWLVSLASLVNQPIGAGSLFIAVWIIGWTIGGAVAGLWLAWKTKGFEQIILDRFDLRIKHNLFGLGPEKTYSLNAIDNLRAAGYFGIEEDSSLLKEIGMKGGMIAFDSETEVVRFGVSLEEREAEEVVEFIKVFEKT